MLRKSVGKAICVSFLGSLALSFLILRSRQDRGKSGTLLQCPGKHGFLPQEKEGNKSHYVPIQAYSISEGRKHGTTQVDRETAGRTESSFRTFQLIERLQADYRGRFSKFLGMLTFSGGHQEELIPSFRWHQVLWVIYPSSEAIS